MNARSASVRLSGIASLPVPLSLASGAAIISILKITATSSWSGQTEFGIWKGPDGNTAYNGCSGCWCPNLTNIKLIGRVGSNYFGIGSNFNGTAPYTGRLYLLINDCYAANAAGSVTANINY